jgi:ABC-type transport system substrate-binding protein
METKLNPNKFEEMVTPLYAQIKEIKSQINAIGLQAKDECYEILSKNPKGNCILFAPESEDILYTEDHVIWAVGAFDGTIQLKSYADYNEPSPDDKFQPLCYKDNKGKDAYLYCDLNFLDLYKSIVKNLDKAMPLEEAEQYYPQWLHEEGEWQMVKK